MNANHLRFVAGLMIPFLSASCAGRPTHSSQDNSIESAGNREKAISKVWNRWAEQGGDDLLVGKREIVPAGQLETLLSDDPDPAVVSKLDSSRSWDTWATVSAIVFIGGAVTAGLGYNRDKESNERVFSNSALAALWSVSLLGLGGTLLSLSMKSSALSEATRIHNERIRKAERSKMVSLELEWKF